MVDLFAGIETTKARMDANYERPGHYVERIDAIKMGESRKGDNFLVVEKTVLHVFDDDEGRGHKAGESVSHMMMQKHDSFLGNVKAMVAKLLDCATESVDSASCNSICHPEEQPLSGMIIECKNRNIKTKADKDFTVISYLREVKAQELIDSAYLTQRILDLYFEGGALLTKMAALGS